MLHRANSIFMGTLKKQKSSFAELSEDEGIPDEVGDEEDDRNRAL